MADLFPKTEPAAAGGRKIGATYDYRDASGDPAFQVVRFEPKGFAQRRRVDDDWVWNLQGVEPVLYRLPELLAADPEELIFVVEGEKDVDRLGELGLVATTNPGGAGKWRPEYSASLAGRDVAVLPDKDEPGRKHARDVSASLAGIAPRVRIVELPGLPAKGDVSDWLAGGGTRDGLIALLEMAPEFVSATTPARGQTEGFGGGTSEAATEPPSMTLAETLDAVVTHLARFVHFASHEHAQAIALWVAHTHVPLERLEQSPILAVTSAVKQSGKTKLLDVLEFLVRDPWRITRPSESVLFRKIDNSHPTVLLDEVDTIFNDKSGTTEGIRSVFNSGNRRGTKVPRNVAVGKTFTLVEFDVFCPKVTAGIGGLPDTILDRAIVIGMQRRSRREHLERLRERRSRALGTPLRDALAFHVSTIEDLTLPDEALPSELDDRAQDGWEPLLAIADAAGGHWPGSARRAAVAIHRSRVAADDTHALRLLHDCRTVFESSAGDFLPTAELRAALIALDQSLWSDIRGKEITPHYMGKLLREFHIESSRHRPFGVGNPIHGYFRAAFRDAWDRYASPSPESGTSGTSGTDPLSSARSAAPFVPDVPDVPDVAGQDEIPVEGDYPRSAWDPDAGADDPEAELWFSAPLPGMDLGAGS
jgi:hypothetical protein